MTEWIFNWKQNGWKTSNNKQVSNQDLLTKIDKYMNKATIKNKIKFHHIRAHTGKQDFYSLGNEEADELAKKGGLQCKKSQKFFTKD